jgi:hypothetical protein
MDDKCIGGGACLAVAAMCLMVGLMAGLVFGLWLTRHSYRDGQIDAANGKMNYELRDQADGSRAWERNDDGN